jgi:signal transduction histidine kinase
VDSLVSSSERMARLIDDLLAYSRLGRQPLALERIELDELLASVIRNVAPRAEELGASIEVEPGLPAVRGQPTLLWQVFTNLIENALTYRQPDVAPGIRITGERHGLSAVISVADNGIGIAPEHFERIFAPFERLHESQEHPGTGIGLAIVKRAVQLHHGAVTLESQPGVGSTFKVRLQQAPALLAPAP